MHDGYLFTLGICGSAAEDDPAPEVLSALLGALPPVKRAAFLGELPAGQPDLLLAEVVADMRDAELIVIVTPATVPQLPARLTNLLRAACAADLAGRYAALVTVGPYAQAVLHELRAAVATCGFVIAGAFALVEDAPLPEAELRAAYTAARAALAPHALP
ncbi:MAG: NAD(P)H-dependent oxidoreductase [Chloroflexus sp.]|nr:NAD(P)H-dependent oxidoreductase [Chloroflexus sp.]